MMRRESERTLLVAHSAAKHLPKFDTAAFEELSVQQRDLIRSLLGLNNDRTYRNTAEKQSQSRDLE